MKVHEFLAVGSYVLSLLWCFLWLAVIMLIGWWGNAAGTLILFGEQ